MLFRTSFSILAFPFIFIIHEGNVTERFTDYSNCMYTHNLRHTLTLLFLFYSSIFFIYHCYYYYYYYFLFFLILVHSAKKNAVHLIFIQTDIKKLTIHVLSTSHNKQYSKSRNKYFYKGLTSMGKVQKASLTTPWCQIF